MFKSEKLSQIIKTVKFWRRIGRKLEELKDLPIETVNDKISFEVVQMKYFGEVEKDETI